MAVFKIERMVRLKIIEALSRLDDWKVLDTDHIRRNDGLWIKNQGSYHIGDDTHGIAQMIIDDDKELDAAFQKAVDFNPYVKRERSALRLLGIDI